MNIREAVIADAKAIRAIKKNDKYEYKRSCDS